MLPGMGGLNSRDVNKLMKKMGVTVEELDVTEVVIKTSRETITIHNPSVAIVRMQGHKTYQITGGEETVQEKKPYTREDVKLVAEKADVAEPEAEEALEKTGGDVAEAILLLQEK